MEDDDVSLSRCSNSAIQMFLPVLTELSSQQVVMVSHDLDQLDDFDRVLVFDAGRLVADDVPARAVGHYRQLVR